MVIKEGYKQTEIGVIPNDWEVKSLGDIAFVLGGGTPSTMINSYWNGDINWFTPTEIGSKKYSYESIRKLTKLGFENSSSKILPVGTILLTSRAGIGDISILMNEGCTNQGFQSLVAKKDVHNEFLYYLVSTLKSVLLQNASGSTFLEISPNKVKSIEIVLPSLAEQTAIATALSDADGLITGLEKLIAKKRNIKQGAMQQLLQPKEGWEVKKLGEICDFQNGTALEKYFNKKDGYKVISIGNYSENGVFNETNNFIAKYNYPFVKKFILNKGELAFLMNDKTAVGTIIGRVLYIEENDKYIFNQRTMRLSSNIEFIDSKFLFHLINSDHYHSLFVKLAKPGTQIYLNTNDVLDFEIIIPNIEEQVRIATILSDMDAELSALEQKLEKYKKIKLGMMQELLTGKTRLN